MFSHILVMIINHGKYDYINMNKITTSAWSAMFVNKFLHPLLFFLFFSLDKGNEEINLSQRLQQHITLELRTVIQHLVIIIDIGKHTDWNSLTSS